LIDHIRSVDKGRVRLVFGQIDASELKAIDEGLVLFLGLGPRLTPSEQTPGASRSM
jgi:hypothetical protein